MDKAEAKPAELARRRNVGLLEAFENPVGQFRRKANARVADRQAQLRLPIGQLPPRQLKR
jgi:hypothetical protein